MPKNIGQWEKMFERAEQPDQQTDACAKEIQLGAQKVCQIP
jgi:hypothetical protein